MGKLKQTGQVHQTKRFSARSITRRWVVNGLGSVFVIIFLLEIVFAVLVKSYYYDGIQQKIAARNEIVINQLLRYSNSSPIDFSTQLRNIVEEFKDKDKMELMGINWLGQVTITSSGFEPENPGQMPDYNQALVSEDQSGVFIGESPTGEKIMALCSLSPVTNSQLSAIRFVVSLEKIDGQILFIIMLMVLIGLGVLLFVIVSGSYFINSIVLPIGQISASAKKIALGDFETYLDKRYDDEIGDLCDTINDMAEELKEADTMKNDFISSVSHELRTPLTAIRGWGETLLASQNTDTETFHKGMKIILNETDRLSVMVEDLLDFSRMQSGHFKLIKGKMDLIAELDEAVFMFTERAKKEGKTIDYRQTEQIAAVMGDKNRLRQVFINIIDNALKYIDSGGAVEVETIFGESSIQVVVSDDGCGISADDLAKVKVKFYKANNTVRGSGIGLAVADEIVQLHDGQLLIESEEKIGTRVTIVLPMLTLEQ